MGVITIQCPQTGRWVSTGIELEREDFEGMPVVRSTMHCWMCGGDHTWSKRWATFVEEDREALKDVNLMRGYVEATRCSMMSLESCPTSEWQAPE